MPADLDLRQALRDEEAPSTWESLFRFIGRPAFVVRNLLMRDPEGAFWNGLQFFNELSTIVGPLNQELTTTGILGKLGVPVSRDLTTAEQRPEASDVLHRWGVIPDLTALGGWEKLGIDLIGGILTDPLTLVGAGAGKGGLTAAQLSTRAGPGLLYQAARRAPSAPGALFGPEAAQAALLNQVRRLRQSERVGPLLEGLADDQVVDALRRGRVQFPRQRPAGQYGGGIPGRPIDLEARAERFGPRFARAAERDAGQELIGRIAAVEGVSLPRRTIQPVDDLARWNEWNVPGSAAAAREVDDLIRGVRDFAVVPAKHELPQALRAQLGAADLLDVSLAEGLGPAKRLLVRPGREEVGRRVQAVLRETGGLNTPAAGRARAAAMRDLGYSNEWIQAFLTGHYGQAADLTSFDEAVRLGASLPSSTANQAVEALVRHGMAPSSGLPFRLPEVIGKPIQDLTGFKYRGGYVWIPPTTIATATIPGAIRRAWRGPFPLDEPAQKFWEGASRIVDRFLAGREIAPATEEALRGADSQRRATYQQETIAHGKMFQPWVEGNRVEALDDLTRNFQQTSDAWQIAANAMEQFPEAGATERFKALADELGRAGALEKSLTLAPLIRDAQDALTAGPWNRTVTWDALRQIAAAGEGSTVPSVRRAGRAALQVSARWEVADRGMALAWSEFNRSKQAVADWAESLASTGAAARGAVDEAADYLTLLLQQGEVGLLEKHLAEGHLEVGAKPVLVPMRELKAQIAKALKEATKRRKALAKRGDALRDALSERFRAQGFASVDDALRELDRAYVQAGRRFDDARAELLRLSDGLEGEMLKRDGEVVKAVRSAARTMLAGTMTREVVEKAVRRLGPEWRPHVENVVGFVQERMRRIGDSMTYWAKSEADLLRGAATPRAAWQEQEFRNPFYLPHQMETRLLDLLTDRSIDGETRKRINSAFDSRANYRTTRAWLDRLRDLADEVGLPEDAGELQQTNFLALSLKRSLAHADVVARQQAYQAAIKHAGVHGGRWGAYQAYLEGALRPVSAKVRRNPFIKVMLGGPLDFPMSVGGEKAAAFLNRSTGNPRFARILSKSLGEGRGKERVLRVQFPGMRTIWAPFLTSHPLNVRFRVRNIFSSFAQLVNALHHEGIGLDGWKQLWQSLKHDGLVRWGLAHFNRKFGRETPAWGATETALRNAPVDRQVALSTGFMVKAYTAASLTERLAARDVLLRLPTKVGPYSWREALEVTDGILGSSITPVDLDEGVEAFAELFPALARADSTDVNAMGRLVRALGRYVDFGHRIVAEQEHQWRALLALKLLEQGEPKSQIARLVNRAFVDYSRQGEVETWIRATIPFARFAIGSAPWARDLLLNPAGGGAGIGRRVLSLQTIGQAQRSLTAEGEPLPERLEGSIALPLPWRDREGNQQFFTQLGLPQEQVVRMLSLASFSPQAFRREALGGVHPALKLPAEAITGRSFYYGTEWGTYRRAGVLERPFAREVPGPDGQVLHEVPGLINELSSAAPTAWINTTLNRLFDERQPPFARLLNVATGLRVQSVDVGSERRRRIADYLRSKLRSGDVGVLEVFFSRLPEDQVDPELAAVLAEWRALRTRARREGA